MKVIYNKPRDIVAEIKKIISDRCTNTAGETIKEIHITVEEKILLVKQLTENWDNKSRVQCHSIQSNDDPYCGGYKYLEWDGRWEHGWHTINIIVK